MKIRKWNGCVSPRPVMKMAVPIHVTTKRVMVEMFDSTLNRMNSQMFG